MCICIYNLATNVSHSNNMHNKHLLWGNNMSNHFKQAMYLKFNDQKHVKIAYINKNDSTNVLMERFRNPLNFSDYFDSNIINTNVNNPKKILKDELNNRYNFLWPIYNFSRENKKLPYNELLKKFLNENDFKYLMTNFESKDLEKLLNLKLEESDKSSDFKLWVIGN